MVTAKGEFGELWPDQTIPEPIPITGLHPVVAGNEGVLVRMAARRGINIVITHGYRSVAEQDALLLRGGQHQEISLPMQEEGSLIITMDLPSTLH